MERLRKRAEFVAVAKGRRVERSGFVIQGKRQASAAGFMEEAPARFGFTVTKKIGNSVVRNRIRRRLREVVRKAGPGVARSGTDYVLMARQGALTLPFERLAADLRDGIERLNQILSPARGEAGDPPAAQRGDKADRRNSGT